MHLLIKNYTNEENNFYIIRHITTCKISISQNGADAVQFKCGKDRDK